MNAPYEALRERIDELAEELVRDLAEQGLPEEGMPLVRSILEAELKHDRLRPLIEASMGEAPADTLDRFVVSLDPRSRCVTLSCKN